MMTEIDIDLHNVKVGAHGEIHGCVRADGLEEGQLFQELQSQMNDHFNNTQMLSIIPHIPRQNEVCAAKVNNEWHRVRVSVILSRRAGQHANCFLLDDGREESISVLQLRLLPERFMSVPYQVKQIHLHGVQPSSMMIREEDLMVTNQPVKRWDEAAIRFIRDSIKAATKVRCSVIHHARDDSIWVRMYLEGQSGAYRCLNDALIKKGFAVAVDMGTEGMESGPLVQTQDSASQTSQRRNVSTFSGYDHGTRSDTELTLQSRHQILMYDGYSTDNQCSSGALQRSLHRSPATVSNTRNFVSAVRRGGSASPHRSVHSTSSQLLSDSDYEAQRNEAINMLSKKNGSVTSCYIQSKYLPTSNDDNISYNAHSSSHSNLNGNAQNQEKSPSALGDSVSRADGAMFSAVLNPPNQNANQSTVAGSDSEVFLSNRLSTAQTASKQRNISSKIANSSDGQQCLNSVIKYSPNACGYQSDRVSSELTRNIASEAHSESNTCLDSCNISQLDLLKEPSIAHSSILSASMLGRGGFSKSRLPGENTMARKSLSTGAETGQCSPFIQESCLSLAMEPTAYRMSPICNHTQPGTTLLQKGQQATLSEVGQTIDEKKREMYGSMTGKKLLDKLSYSAGRPNNSHTLLVDNSIGTSILVHGSRPPKPFPKMKEKVFKEQVSKHWKENPFSSPFLIQSYAWPVVLRGQNIVAISPPSTGKTLAYLYPLITFLSDTKMYKEIPQGMGPYVVILAPTWRQVQRVYDITCDIVSGGRNMTVHLVHGGGNEENKACTLINGCEILVATPPSLRRIIDKGYTDLFRLCHMVFDDADRLLKTYSTEVNELLKTYTEKVQPKMKRSSCPRQLLVFGAQWNEAVQQFMENRLHEPILVISSATEASIYGKVKQVPHICRSDQRMRQVLGLLENMDADKNKIIIFASSQQDIQHLESTLHGCSHYCRSVTPSMEKFIVDHVREEWSQNLPLMICCDEHISEMDICNATAVIHYDLPSSKSRFSNRLACMRDYFYNFCVNKKEAPVVEPVSHLIITEHCKQQMSSLMDFLSRSRATISPELQSFMNGIIEGREEDKDKILCKSKLAFGFCREKWRCKYRHTVITDVDVPLTTNWLPDEGEVQLNITHVQDASRYFARVLSVRMSDNRVQDLSEDYIKLQLDLACWFSDVTHQKRAVSPEIGDVCCYENDETFHRVLILRICNVRREQNRSPYIEALVKFVDIGRVDSISAQDLFKLPKMLRTFPFQAVEIFICGVKPKDKDSEWTPKANTFVNELIHGKVFEGKIVMRLGDILWLDPLVMRVNLSETRCIINKFYVSKELINNGLADNNPTHLTRLLKFCEGHVSIPKALLAKTKTTPTLATDVLPASRLYHEVYVSSVSDPGLFYLQRKDKAQDLEELMEELALYIENLDLEEDICQSFSVGECCLVEYTSFDQRWYRGRILRKEEDQYEIFFADYGDKDMVSKSRVRKFPYDRFTELPLQAIECTLAGVSPTGELFEKPSGDFLWDLSHYVNDDIKTLMAQVVDGDRLLSQYAGHQKFVVQLTNTNGSSDINLSQELVWSRVVRMAENSTSLQPLFSHKKKKIYSSTLEKIPDMCVTVHQEEDETKALDVANQMFVIVHHVQLKMSTGILTETMLKTSLVCLTCITKLIGHIRQDSAHSKVLDCLHVLMQLGERFCEEFITCGGLQSLVNCLERNHQPVVQHQAAEVIGRLARVSQRFTSYFQTDMYLQVLGELLETTTCQLVQGSVCLAMSALCTGSESVFVNLMQRGICQKLAGCLTSSTEHHTIEGALMLIATLNEHDSNHGDVLKESLIESIINQLERTTCDKCVQLSVQQCDNFAATRRKHKTFLLEMHMVKVLNRLLGLSLQPSTSQLCKDLRSSLVIKVPSEPMARQYERPDTTSQLTTGTRMCCPEVCWSQDSSFVILSIKLAEVNPSEDVVHFTETSVTFRATVSGAHYRFHQHLYDRVIVDRCKVVIKPRSVLVSLKKVNKGRWPRLLFDKDDKPPYLSIDFERLVDSSDEAERSDDDHPFVLQGKRQEKRLPAMKGSTERSVQPGDVATDTGEDTDDSLEAAQDPDLRDPDYFEPFN